MKRNGARRHMDAMEAWRLGVVARHVTGELLDIGCGYNNLVARHGSGVGVDVHPWPGAHVRIGDAARLPFRDASFDTVTIVAALNHIPNRRAALAEARRVLRPGGRLVLTMIAPWVGRLAHLVFRHDEAVRGGFQPGEAVGLTSGDVRALLGASGFRIAREEAFELGLNTLYVAEPNGGGSDSVSPKAVDPDRWLHA